MADDTAKKPDVDVLPVPAPAPGVSQSFAATAPPQSVSLFNQAVQQLGLTPQEQYLYQHHLANANSLPGSGYVAQPGGDVSTVLQAVVQGPDGRFYNIPTVWNGAVLPTEQAQQQAAQAGWDKWPAYATPQEADARYINDMHPFMEREGEAWRAQHPNADPMVQMMLRQQAAQHPVLQMLEQLRQQQAAAPPGRQGQAGPAPGQQAMAVPPHLPQGMEVPDIIAPAPRSRDYPQDDEYGRIPKQGPALTPVQPTPEQMQALLLRLGGVA